MDVDKRGWRKAGDSAGKDNQTRNNVFWISGLRFLARRSPQINADTAARHGNASSAHARPGCVTSAGAVTQYCADGSKDAKLNWLSPTIALKRVVDACGRATRGATQGAV